MEQEIPFKALRLRAPFIDPHHGTISTILSVSRMLLFLYLLFLVSTILMRRLPDTEGVLWVLWSCDLVLWFFYPAGPHLAVASAFGPKFQHCHSVHFFHSCWLCWCSSCASSIGKSLVLTQLFQWVVMLPGYIITLRRTLHWRLEPSIFKHICLFPENVKVSLYGHGKWDSARYILDLPVLWFLYTNFVRTRVCPIPASYAS